MDCLDNTQTLLVNYLADTENILNDLLEKEPYLGHAKIIPNLDLGFPHDVIRLAGGFATGACVLWESKIPFVPVDICMNACTVSIYELNDEALDFFCEKRFHVLLEHLAQSSYKANFHRGNHFISLLEDLVNGTHYLMMHSSAAEFETLYNGLYPVEGNYIYDNTKVYDSRGRYVRYVDGVAAEIYWKLASNLYRFNENRHDFIVAALLEKDFSIQNAEHYHHYGMPCQQIALMGCHLMHSGQKAPLLTRPGENVYLIQYENVLDKSLAVSQKNDLFVTPHGFGKHHIYETSIQVDYEKKRLQLDQYKYKIMYGESLRAHPGLEIRRISPKEFFMHFSKVYNYRIVKEFRQLASFNKQGYIEW